MPNRRPVPLLVVLIALAVVLIALVDWRSFSGGVSDQPEAAREVKNLKKAVAAALTVPEHEDFDRRIEGKGQQPMSAQQREAVEALRREVPDVQVEFDVIKGSPRSVMSNSRFLTQSEPMPRALSYEQAMAKVKAYVNTHRSLFLHGGEVLDAAKVTRKDTTAATGLQTLIWEQQAAGLPVFESSMKANVSKSGEIMSVASELMRDAEAAAADYLATHTQTGMSAQISVERAVVVAAESIDQQVVAAEVKPKASVNPELAYQFFDAPGLSRVWAQKVWLPMDASTVKLAWEVNVESAMKGLFTLVVDVDTGTALTRATRTAADAIPQYRVWTSDSPTPMSPGFYNVADATTQPPLADRQLVQIQSLNPTASPNGWINDGVSTTTGNNVNTYTDRDGNDAPDPGSMPTGSGTDSRTFDFAVDLSQDPSTYSAASVTQLFYRTNWIHDRLYSLGFTETSGNFQISNFGRNGPTPQDAGDQDPVSAEVQDAANTGATGGQQFNNANFATPQDGIPPRMQIYVFNGPTPDRDASLNAETTCHEYAHGLTNRLVGNATGLTTMQSRGMGEGWGDFYALSLLSEAHDDPNGNFVYAAYTYLNLTGVTPPYTSNYYFGARRYPKSTDRTKNPLTFKDIDPTQAVSYPGVPISPRFTSSTVPANQAHNMGEVWSSLLWEVRTRMVERYGWAVGNQATLQLVTDGLKLTPLNPNFIQARNAILQADLNGGGLYRAILWNGFASRGLGNLATSPASTGTAGLVEDFSVPANVDSTVPVVTFSPLVNQQSFFEFSDVGPEALGGTMNETGGGVFFIEEFNTSPGTPNRFWNGSTWVAGRDLPGTRLPCTVTGGTWKPAAGLSLPLSASLRNGLYLVTVRLADNAGNVTEQNIVLNRSVNAESTPPLASISAPLHNATIAGFSSLTGSASDPAGGSGLTGAVTLTISNDGEYWSGSQWQSTLATVGANVQTNGTWNCTLLPAGPHFRTGVFQVTAQAFDWAGNTSAIQNGVNQITFTVDPSLDTTAPAPVITSPATGSVRSGVVEITGTAADSGGAGLLPIVVLSIQQGTDYWTGTNWSSSLYSHAVPVATDGSWRFSSLPRDGNIRAGIHLVTAICYDYGGNVSTPQSGVSQVSYTIDSTPPTGTVTHPQDQAHYAAFPAFNGTAQDASGIQTVLLYIRRGRDSAYWTGSRWDQNAHALSSQYNAETQTFTSTFTPPSVGVNAIGGTYYYDAIAVDAGGLYTQFGATVIIDYTATFTWTGASLAGNNLWGDSSNWSSTVYGFIPGPDDIAIINSGSPATFAGENISVRELRLNGGTLTAGTIHVGTACQMNGGTFHGALSLESGSLSSWTSGTLTGSLSVALGATLKVEGHPSKWLGVSGKPAVLNNFGTLRFLVPDGSSTVARITGFNHEGGNPTLNNKPSGVIDIAGDGSPLSHYQYTGMDFINEGRIVKTAGTGTTVFDSYWVLDNRDGGIIESAVQEGSVQFSNAVPVTFRSGTILRGPGTVRLASGVVNATAGTWNVDGAGTLLVGGSTLAAPQVGSLTLTPSAGGSLRWLSGTIHGNVTIPAGATLKVEGAYGDKTLGAGTLPAVLDNFGTIRCLVAVGNSEVARITGWNHDGGNPTINNKPSGVFEVEGDGSPLTHYQYTAMAFNNQGRIVKTAGTGVTNWNSYWSLDNAPGAVIESTIPEGTLSFATPVPTTLQSGTILRGPGTVLLAGGTITGPAGTWTVDTNGVLVLAGATLEAPQVGSLTLVPGMTWRNGTIHGNVTIPSGAMLKVEGAQGNKTLGSGGKPAVLDNFGTIRCTVSTPYTEVAQITGWNHDGGNPTINNKPSGVFEVQGDGSPLSHYQSTAMAFHNEGRIVKTAGTAVTNWNSYWSLDNAPGAVIESAVPGGTFRFATPVATTLQSGTILRGPGSFLMAGGTITGPAGTWTVDTSGVLVLAGATLEAPQAGSLTLVPGMTWLNGTIHGNVTIPAGAMLKVDGGYSDKNLGSGGKPAVLDNFGTIRSYVAAGNSEVARITGWNHDGGHPTINNKSSGIFEIEGDGSPLSHYQFTAMAFHNEGRIVKTAGTGVTNWNSYWSLDNAPGAVIESAVPGGTFRFATPVPTTLQSGSILRGPGTFLLAGGTITAPAGTWTVNNSGALVLAGAALNLPSIGSLTLAAAPGSLTWLSGTIHGNMTIPAGTTLKVDGGYGDKVLGTGGKPAVLENLGSIRFCVAIGNSEVARITGWNHEGGNPTLINAAGGVMSIEGDGTPLTHYQYSNMSLQNAGRIVKTAGSGAANINGYWPLTNSGTLAADVGTLDLNVPVSFNHGTRIEGTTTSQCRIVDNTTTLRGTTTIASGRLVQLGGIVTGHADGTGMIEGGTLQWTGGTLGGTLHFASTAIITATGAGAKTLGANAILNNAGNFTWSEGTIVGGGNSAFMNLPSGTFNAPVAGSFSHNSGGNAFTNAGTMNIGASPGTLTFSSPWSFTQSSTGILNIELGGTSTTQFDRLLANGPVALAGTLNVTAINSFVPASGNSFNVMTFASHTGTFAAVNSGNMLFTKTYDSTSFTLATAAEPATYTEWKDLYFGPGSPNAGDTLDPDNDGISNLMEYATGNSPSAPGTASTSVTTPDAGSFDFIYSRKASVVGELTFQVQWKDTLEGGTWSSAGISETIQSTTNGIQQVKATVPAGAAGHRFVHLLVTKP